MDMGEVMRARRAHLHLSQQQLATLVGASVRTISRLEAGEREPPLSLALRLADALDISVSDLAGGPERSLDLGGAWWASWQTYKDGVERIDTHAVTARQEGDYVTLVAERARDIEEGSYAWQGEIRLWDNEALMGWYRSTDDAVRSKGTIYFALHQHGRWMGGRWVGQSYDGSIVSGFGTMAREQQDAEALIRELIDQGGTPWTRSLM